MFLTCEGIFLSTGMEKGIKYNQDQSSIMLLVEHNFRYNAVVLMVTRKSIMHKFSGIISLTLVLLCTNELRTLISRLLKA